MTTKIGSFKSMTIITEEDCHEISKLLLDNKLRCNICGGNRFVVDTLIKTKMVVVGGSIPIICPTEESDISITKVLKCAKEHCGSVSFKEDGDKVNE